MLKTIIKEYGSILKSALKIIALLLLCAMVGAAFTLPLWKFASCAPKVYTVVVISVFALAFLYLLFSKIKESGARNFVFSALKFFIIAAGVFLCFFFVINGMRILAVPTIILIIIFYGICAHIAKR